MFEKLPEDKFDEMVAELKNTDVSILIWGGGLVGRKVKKYLGKISFRGRTFWQAGKLLLL